MCCARTYDDDGPVRARNHMLGACPMSVFAGTCARPDEVVARWIQKVGLNVIDTGSVNNNTHLKNKASLSHRPRTLGYSRSKRVPDDFWVRIAFNLLHVLCPYL